MIGAGVDGTAVVLEWLGVNVDGGAVIGADLGEATGEATRRAGDIVGSLAVCCVVCEAPLLFREKAKGDCFGAEDEAVEMEEEEEPKIGFVSCGGC